MFRRDRARATHGLPGEVSAWRTTLGLGRTRPDSLIVNAKGIHLCCLHGSLVLCCLAISPCMTTIDSNLSDTPDMGEACSLSANVEHETMRWLS
jgi:hypothetical protein